MSEVFARAVDEASMIAAGKRLGSDLEAGDIVALNGELGAGKTHFSKGIVAGLGSPAEVTSPTFSLVHEYPGGQFPVFHFDFYRLDSIDELYRLGWDEYLDEEGVVIVEWADKFPEALPSGTKWLDLSIASDGQHEVSQR